MGKQNALVSSLVSSPFNNDQFLFGLCPMRLNAEKHKSLSSYWETKEEAKRYNYQFRLLEFRAPSRKIKTSPDAMSVPHRQMPFNQNDNRHEQHFSRYRFPMVRQLRGIMVTGN